MNRYEKQNAIEKITGYYLPRCDESAAQTFDRAKEEALKNMKISVENVNQIKIDDFFPNINKNI